MAASGTETVNLHLKFCQPAGVDGVGFLTFTVLTVDPRRPDWPGASRLAPTVSLGHRVLLPSPRPPCGAWASPGAGVGLTDIVSPGWNRPTYKGPCTPSLHSLGLREVPHPALPLGPGRGNGSTSQRWAAGGPWPSSSATAPADELENKVTQ